MGVIAPLAAAYLILAIGVLILVAQGAVRKGWQSEAAFWSVVGIVCLLLMAGAVPWFWHLPVVAKVQFPWRIMIVVEFACITALCMVAWPVRARVVPYVFALAIIAFIPGVGEMVFGVRHRTEVSWAIREEPAELKQFQPAGYPQRPDGGYADLNLELVQDVAMIACTPAVRVCRAESGPFGSLDVEIEADMPTTVVVRRFYYPFWRLSPPLPITATEPLRLVSFVAPPGRNVWRLERTAVPAERASWAISGLSVVLLLAAAGMELFYRGEATSRRNSS
jgi:hypothetical protein